MNQRIIGVRAGRKNFEVVKVSCALVESKCVEMLDGDGLLHCFPVNGENRKCSEIRGW